MKKVLLTFLFALVAIVTAQGQSYCISGGPSSAADSELTGVQLNGDTDTISNIYDPLDTIACGATKVQFFLGDTADISVGASYTVSVTMGTCGGSYSGAIAAWIDFNADGDFDDAGELLGSYAGAPTTTQDFTFVVPGSAALSADSGATRMRVMQQESASTTTIAPCNSFTWGAVEDYSIKIHTLNSPSCNPPASLALGFVDAFNADILWNSSLSQFDIEYGLTGFVQGTGSAVSSTVDSIRLTGLSAQTSYDVYVRSNCKADGGGTSSWVGPITFTTGCAPGLIPLTEDFDTWASTIPACWSGIKTSTSGFGWTWDGSGTGSSGTGPLTGNSGDYYLYLETSGSGTVSYANLPPMDLSSVPNAVIEFAYHMHGSSMGDLTVEVSNDNVSWTVLNTISGQQQPNQADPYASTLVSLVKLYKCLDLYTFRWILCGFVYR